MKTLRVHIMRLQLRLSACVLTILILALHPLNARQSQEGGISIAATTLAYLRLWDDEADRLVRQGDLRRYRVQADEMLTGGQIERLAQYHKGVPIFGADLVRASHHGVSTAILGRLYRDVALDTTPTISATEAAARLIATAGKGAVLLGVPELVILPLDTSGYVLAYHGRLFSGRELLTVFVDARNGAELLRWNDLHTQAAVGRGRGVLGDEKKISTRPMAGRFVAEDWLRPPSVLTFDLRGDLRRAIDMLMARTAPADVDLASDADNDWSDSAAVDAHVHVGWTYDYLHKRFGRRGLDDRDRPILTIVHGVAQQSARDLKDSDFGLFAVNAFWCGGCGPGGVGMMYFGSGIPANFYLGPTGQSVTYLAGALDVVAHEYAHGVTDYTSRLIYLSESGALNEAFSDIIGTSVEFFYHPTGDGLRRADYLLGEDVFRAVVPGARNGIRSMADPVAYGHPDHYSRRFVNPLDESDVGFEHANSAIASHAFYLAIEGGTNRTSGLSVHGVGSANREQIERVFYRAFTLYLPANATFATARVATILAARDLYGAGSAVERAVTQAWNAVGVF